MRRREFIAALGGAVTWPRIARAQPRDQVRRIAWVGVWAEAGLTFGRELARLGWIEGRNVRVDYLVESDEQRLRVVAPDIVRAAPDVIVTTGTLQAEIFKQLTDAIPIVFENVADPVASGLVASFAHPSGNATGFSFHQFSFAGKWLAILKELVPGIANVMMLYQPSNPNWRGYWPVLEPAASSLGVKVHPAPADTFADLVRQIETFAHDPGGGMIVIPSALTAGNSDTIVAFAARHRLPTIYTSRLIAARGGLASYGADPDDLDRGTAQYADRILKGTKAADLPVQAPTKFQLVINAKTAEVLGLTIPETLKATADEVIE